jgi:hypothetical protein
MIKFGLGFCNSFMRTRQEEVTPVAFSLPSPGTFCYVDVVYGFHQSWGTCCLHSHVSALKMEVAHFGPLYQTKQHHIPEDNILHSQQLWSKARTGQLERLLIKRQELIKKGSALGSQKNQSSQCQTLNFVIRVTYKALHNLKTRFWSNPFYSEGRGGGERGEASCLLI